MTISVTNIAQGGIADSTSVQLTVPVGGVPAGSLILVWASDDNSNIIPTIADDAGNSYTRVNDTQSWNLTLFYAFNCLALTSGQHITVSAGTSSLRNVTACYATGIQTGSDPFDSAVHKSSSGTNNSPTVTSGSPAVAGELFIGIISDHGGASTVTQASGWSAPPNSQNNGGNPLLFGGNQVNAGTGTLTYAPAKTAAIVTWDIAIYGFKPPTTQTLTLLGAAGSFSLTGSSALLSVGRRLLASVGSYAITGASAKFVEGKGMPLAAGSYTITSDAALLSVGRNLLASHGAYTITGDAALLSVGRNLLASPGAYTITGDDALLSVGRDTLASPGFYNLTGYDAALNVALGFQTDTGSYTLSGFDANLEIARVIEADAGDYSITGADAALNVALGFPIDAGSYTMSGSDASLLRAIVLLAGQGTFSINGVGASTTDIRFGPDGEGRFSINGRPANLRIHRHGDDDEHPGRGGGGIAPRDPTIHAGEFDLFRRAGSGRYIDALVPPTEIAHHNLTTPQFPHSRPSAVPFVSQGKPQ